MTRQGLLKQIQRRNEPLKRIAELKEQNAEAKEIIAEFLHLVTYYTTAEEEERLKEKAKKFLNWPIVEMVVKE